MYLNCIKITKNVEVKFNKWLQQKSLIFKKTALLEEGVSVTQTDNLASERVLN